MKFVSVSQFAKERNLSERTVRHYCATGKIEGAFLTGKTWNIPEDFDIATGIALGYKVEGDPVNELKTERLPLDEILEIYE